MRQLDMFLCFAPRAQVPVGMKIRVTFTMFRLKEPGVNVRICSKDYVQVNGTK